MATRRVQQKPSRSLGRKMLRGIAYLPLGVLPMVVFALIFGSAGTVVGLLTIPNAFFLGFTGRNAFGGTAKDVEEPIAALTAPTTVKAPSQRPVTPPPLDVAVGSSPEPSRKQRGRWWKIPVGATALIWVIGTLFGPPPPRTQSEAAVDRQAGTQPATQVSTDAASRRATEPPDPMPESRFRYFQQRPCNGSDDCLAANIAAEQTQASRDFNRMARDGVGAAVSKLGPPTFVLRAGDVVGVEGYRQNRTEVKIADAIVGWANGGCHPNELHVMTNGGQSVVSPEPGGTSCTRDGSAYPLPPRTFLCDGGRKSDVLCKLAGVLKLPGVAPRDVLATAASAVDQATALRQSPEQHGFVVGYVMSGVSTCNGMYLGDVPTGGATAATWMAARRRGETAGKAAMAKHPKSFCDELGEKYGPTGSMMPGMFKKLGP